MVAACYGWCLGTYQDVYEVYASEHMLGSIQSEASYGRHIRHAFVHPA